MSRKLKRVLAFSAAAVAAAAVAPGVASAATCTPGVTSQAFSRFGDTNSYYLAPGGSFESSLTWSKSGAASIVAGNEPFMLAGAGDTKSLRLSKGSSVTSPAFCISPETPHLRFVAKANSGNGPLYYQVAFTAAGKSITTSGSLQASDYASWGPSGAVTLNTGNLADGETGTAQVTFNTQNDWQIDDVFIDPRASR